MIILTKTHKFRNFILAFLLIVLFTALICVGAFLLYMKYGISDELDIESLALGQNLTTKIYAVSADGTPVELEEERLFGTENRIWISGDEIPEQVKNAFIAIEDHRFYSHNGIDPKRTAGAVINFFGHQNYGGSTITQQLIKNLTGENSVTVKRKLTEIKRAVTLEKTMSKERILELYLNTVYLSRSCYGIRTAAEKYFSCEVGDLTLAQAATLAGIIQYPSHYDPISHPDDCLERRNTVLSRMHELEMINETEYRSAVSSPLSLNISEPKKEGAHNSWFTDAVIEDVIADLCNKKGYSRAAASSLIYGGGLSIYTTMRPEIQEELEKIYLHDENFPKNTSGYSADSSCVIVDSENGNVVALVGGRGEKKSDRLFCLATQMLRSPGSVIKPVSVYAPALEAGIITWSSVFDDVPCSFAKSGSKYIPWPKNNPRVYSGITNVKTAVEKSINTVSVKVLEQVGIAKSFYFCKKAGLSTLTERKKLPSGGTLTDMAEAPLALGATSVGVSVKEMTAAYTMFAAGGKGSLARTYTKVLDKNGDILLENEQSSAQIISPENAEIMTRLMENVVLRGTANNISLAKSLPIAGKTGTSGANTDRWFIGYTRGGLICGVWCGYKEARDIGTYNANPASAVFDKVMTSLYQNDLLKTTAAAVSAETEKNIVSVLYCRDSGKLPCAACALDPRGNRIELGYFVKGTEPKEKCDAHVLVDYDFKTHAIACEKCPAENIKQIALVKNYSRSFPCQVSVTDAQYMYRQLPCGMIPSCAASEAFYASLAASGEFFGTSRRALAFNRICTEHYLMPDEPEETEETAGTDNLQETTGTTGTTAITNPPVTSDTKAPETKTTATAETTAPETTEKKKSWWQKKHDKATESAETAKATEASKAVETTESVSTRRNKYKRQK